MATERPPLVGEVSANFCGYRVPRGQRDGFLRPYSRLSRPAYITQHNLIQEVGLYLLLCSLLNFMDDKTSQSSQDSYINCRIVNLT
jgi:hypothetical protein